MRFALAIVALSIGAVLAGCVKPTAITPGAGLAAGDLVPLAFSKTMLLDATRAGGEPVIAITPKGTILVASHPGWTHTRYPPSANLALGADGESFIWRSTDNGKSFKPVAPMNGVAGPKGPWAGVSDPDFAIDAAGKIYFTDLGPLTYVAVVRSDDDGATWQLGDPLIPGPVDRQWLMAYKSDVFLSANFFQDGERVMKSSDGAMTWTTVGIANCGGDNAIDPRDGTMYIGCGNGVDVSKDGGKTWTFEKVNGTEQSYRTMAEPAIDAAGNVYVTWSQTDKATKRTDVWMASSTDKGKSWSAPVDVSAGLDTPSMTGIWPWIVAGDAGRVAVLWLGEPKGEPAGTATGDWFIYMASITGADTLTPKVVASQASSGPVHKGLICQAGTQCQADPSAAGDRRLGDFFEAAVDKDGFVHAAFATTTLAADAISHAGYFQQTEGPRLKVS